MKKLFLISIFFLGCIPVFSQVDVFDSRAITLGMSYKNASHFGLYGQSKNVNNSGFSGGTTPLNWQHDEGSAINMFGNYYIFEDNNLQVYNLDQFIYLLSYFGNMNTNHSGELYYSLSDFVTTPSNQLAKVPNAVDYTKPSRFWNYNWINIQASFGRRSLNVGVNLVFKNIGYTGPFTWFVDKNNQYAYNNYSNPHNMRILAGPNIAYRKSLGKLSILSIAGVNFCANRDVTDFTLKNNPFIDITLFLGKKIGSTLSFKYEQINGENKAGFGADPSTKTNVLVQQYELRLGVYVGGR